MALTYINGGGILRGGRFPGIAAVEYADGLSSEIPNLPTQDEVNIQEEQRREEEEAQNRRDNDEERNPQDGDCPDPEPTPTPTPDPTVQYTCRKKASNVKYGNIQIKRHSTSGSGDVCLTTWHENVKRCKDFADANKLPLLAVWSNGQVCGHCVTFASAVASKAFRDFQGKYRIVWCYAESGDSGAAVGSEPCRWCRGEKVQGWGRTKTADLITGFPFVTFWWKKAGFDFWYTGDKLDGGKSGSTGGKNCVNFIKNKFKSVFQKYQYNPMG